MRENYAITSMSNEDSASLDVKKTTRVRCKCWKGKNWNPLATNAQIKETSGRTKAGQHWRQE